MDRRAYLSTVGAAVTTAVAGCPDGGLSESEFDVGMSANAFLPDTDEVGVGDTVVWGNNGSRGHTVTAYGSGIPSDAEFFASGGYEDTAAAREAWASGGGGTLRPGETFENTFETPGDHRYFCIPHERNGMTGVITVTA
jgi:plastocyanin